MNYLIREYANQSKPYYTPVTVPLEVFVERCQQLDSWLSSNPIGKDWYESIDGVSYHEAARMTDEEWEYALQNQDDILSYAMMRSEQ